MGAKPADLVNGNTLGAQVYAALRLRNALRDSSWATIHDIISDTGFKQGSIQKSLVRMWQEGLIEVRRSVGSTTQQYRVRPTGDRAPLFPRQDGWNAQPLADCLGGFTYYHPADCR